MILQEGDKLLVSHRRLYPTDEIRFFVGIVAAYDAGVVKVAGRSFAWDAGTGRVIAKSEPRVKILSLSSGTFFVYQIPDDVDVDAVTFPSREGLISATDGRGFHMNLTEHPHEGRV